MNKLAGISTSDQVMQKLWFTGENCVHKKMLLLWVIELRKLHNLQFSSLFTLVQLLSVQFEPKCILKHLIQAATDCKLLS